MEDFQTRTFQLLQKLETSPSTVISSPLYPSLKWFLWGYFWGIKDQTGMAIHMRITKWVHAKTGKVSSSRWLDHIHHFAANENDDLALELTLRYLREFLEENADSLFSQQER